MDFVESYYEYYDGGKLWVLDVQPLASQRGICSYQDYPYITYQMVPSNIGYARCINLGASYGENPVIAAFNADCVLTPDLLQNCEDALLANSDWGALGPTQVDQKGRFTHAGIFGTNDQPRHRGWKEIDSGQYDDIQEGVTVSGSAYFIKRAVWDVLTNCPIYKKLHPGAVGAFLPTPHYYEETFCSYHCRAHGYKVMYYGKAKMIHKWHQASPVGGWAEQQMPISREIFREMCDAHDIEHD